MGVYYYGVSATCSNDLHHYGVLGMKWGVHKARKALASGDSSKREKAISSLQKHAEKSNAKLAKLAANRAKLDKKADRVLAKNERRASRMEYNAAKYDRKSMSRFTSDQKAYKLERKSAMLKQRASKLRYDNAKIEAKIAKNERLQKAFKKGLSEIDSALIEQGRKYVYGR